jgi:hypothetical protein
VTQAACWRFRWLLETEGHLARLNAALRRADAGDARRLRAMVGELRAARAAVRAAATFAQDVASLLTVEGIEPGVARALAQRLRGCAYSALGLGRRGLEALQAAAERLRMAVGLAGSGVADGGNETSSPPVEQAPSDVGTGTAPWAAGETVPGAPGRAGGLPATAGGQAPEADPVPAAAVWWVRSRDAERTLHRIGALRRCGQAFPLLEGEARFPAGRPRGGIAGYLLVRLAGPAAVWWAKVRLCGMRVLGPAET